MEPVQMVSDVRLPSLVRRQLQEQAQRFSERHASRFGFAQMYMHLKYDGSQIVCNLRYLTDRGRFMATSIGWDVREALQDALEGVDVQLVKQRERRMAVA